uniref:Putative bitil peptide n=1 Tax=Rhipicephalus pulchellus TaxID=72859 RepID=L7LTF3_RHIPC
MYCVAIFLALTIAVVVSGHNNCTNCGSTRCNEFEVAVAKKPRRDRFCRPLLTPTWEMRKLRHCVCKRGYVRNSWGDCIPLLMCRRCKCRLQKDWNLCATACPAACDMTISASCSKTCVPGCDCPPGWVLDQDNWKKCIKVKRCSPVCPPHSQFEPCVNSCAPKCGVSPSRKCKTTCYRGDCVCAKGFAEFVQYGRKICVRQEQCSWYLGTKIPFTLVRADITSGGVSLGGAANRIQGTMLHPGTITVIPGGTPLWVPSGNLITTNGTGGLGTISNSAPILGGVGIVAGIPRVSTEIGVIDGRPGLPPSVSIGNAGILNTGIATRPVATLPISGSEVSTTGSLPLSSTRNIGFGINLPGTLQPAGTVHSTVRGGTGTLSTATTVPPRTLRVGEGIPGIVGSVPEEYRRLTLGTSGAPLPVPVVSNGSGIGGISLSTPPTHSSGLAGAPTSARSTTLGSAIYSPAATTTLGMPPTLALPNDRGNVVSLSGVRLPGTSVTTVSVNALPTTQGGTLGPNAPLLSPAVLGGTGSISNSAGGIFTNSGSGTSAARISAIGVQPSSVLHNGGASAASISGSTSSVSTLTTPQGGNLRTSAIPSGPAAVGGIGSNVNSNAGILTTLGRATSIAGITTIGTQPPLVLQNIGASAASHNASRFGGTGLTAGPMSTYIANTGGALTPSTAIQGGNTFAAGGRHLPASITANTAGVAFTSTSTGNVPGHNFGTGMSTTRISVQGGSVRGMSESTKPLSGAASSGMSGVTSTVPYLPGTAGYNNFLFKRHLQSAHTFASVIAGNSVLTKFPEFQRLYPEGVDLGEIQPELKQQVEVLLRHGALRDES